MGKQITPRARILSEGEKALSVLLEKNKKALPENFNQTRFIQNAISVLSNTDGIERCSPSSIARTLAKGAYLGLDFFNKECYAIPYNGKLSFQTDYTGEIKIAKKHSLDKIQDIFACVVREGDDFSVNIVDGDSSISFTPKPFNDNEIIGAFAVVKYAAGNIRYETMSRKEIEGVRDTYSKVPKGQAWTKSFGEMCRKTVIRRLCKFIQLGFDSIEQEEAFSDGSGMELNRSENEQNKVDNPFSDEVIDIEVSPQEHVADQPQEEEMSQEEIDKLWEGEENGA